MGDLKTILTNVNEEENRRRANMDQKFTEWATILQGVDRQFRIITQSFTEIESLTNGVWAIKGDKPYRDDNSLGNGYRFETELVQTIAKFGPPSINVSYANASTNNGLNGKHVYYSIGREDYFDLPQGFGLAYDKITKENIMEYFANLARNENFGKQSLSKLMLLDSLASVRKFYSSAKNAVSYDLEPFYSSEASLDDALYKAVNHEVWVGITTKECQRLHKLVPVYEFIACDANQLVEDLFKLVEYKNAPPDGSIAGFLNQ